MSVDPILEGPADAVTEPRILDAAHAQREETRRATLFRLSFPLFLNSFFSFAVMLLDTMIISAHSAGAAAAVAIANQILIVALELSTALGTGAVIVIAHHLGHGDRKRAERVAAIAVTANTLFGLVVGLSTALIAPVVLWLLDTPETIAPDIRLYIGVVGVAMAFNGFVTAATASLRGFGRSRTIALLGLFAATFYIAAEYVLILGWGPIPALGVLGSGLGTLLMRIAAALALLVILARGLGLSLPHREALSDWTLLRRLFGLSLPSVSDYIAYGCYQLVLLGFITGFGIVAVLSRAYVMIAVPFFIFVIMALSQGNEVLLGYRRGAGDAGEAYRQALRSSALAAVLAAFLAILLYLSADPYFGLFTDDPAVIKLGTELALLTVLLQPGFAFNTVLFQSLRAVGDVRWPVFVSQGITWGLSLPLAWFLCLHLGYGVVGVWYAMIVEETIKGFAMLWRWHDRKWVSHVVS